MSFLDGKGSPPDLVVAILAEARKSHVLVAKTKLTKLVYLTDLEFARQTGHTLTNWTWKFHLFGPWAPELEAVLDELDSRGLVERAPFASETGAEGFTYTVPTADFDLTTLSGAVQSAASRVLARWLAAPLPRLLDYVYFETEPMQDVQRGQSLNWSLVGREPKVTYRRPESGASEKQRQTLLKRFRERAASQASRAPVQGAFEPRYDDVYKQAVEALETDDDD